MSIEAPTGEETPQKYYSGSYLDEEIAFRAEVRSAAAQGRPVNVEGVHPATIATVAPGLLSNKTEGNPKEEGETLVDPAYAYPKYDGLPVHSTHGESADVSVKTEGKSEAEKQVEETQSKDADDKKPAAKKTAASPTK